MTPAPITLNEAKPSLIIRDLHPACTAIKTAITTLLAVGVAVSIFLNAYWIVPVALFAVLLLSLYPVDRKIDTQRKLTLSVN